MDHPFFFGYGSLVNRRTHGHSAAITARLDGWRRVWRHTDLRPVAYLTAVPSPGSSIEGLIAAVPGADWRALDHRERAYDRVPVTQIAHGAGQPLAVELYTIPPGKHRAPDRTHPVLLSYLDVVVQGYLAEFGPEGAARFFRSTDGWDAPILDDRAQPLYPRAQTLSAAERAFVDDWLDRLAVRRMAPDPDGAAPGISGA
ncbi:gamma-glutamylcyclotransferase family protein [Profundibacterium mesophilum]|uniref:Gamma-glutamylcyclotransferase AIG2-like domain-containing protein n=1 Tax=Profundibacterium mesophilum KAUST100406-0324 TaxID=1037889 RepID=A0A921NRU9_9RHOB|nr:gamma-glutamylcyclotransferase family protein [Profundibacterium mesophilum]KAF0676670.1 Uncharacterized protein PMES_00960 [Profundibacterium mesophilum KAUST100406-0324]